MNLDPLLALIERQGLSIHQAELLVNVHPAIAFGNSEAPAVHLGQAQPGHTEIMRDFLDEYRYNVSLRLLLERLF